MLRIFNHRIVLMASLLVLCFIQNSFAVEKGSRWLVSPELLKHADLKILWDDELPIKKTEVLESLLILGNRIYAISNQNYMVSLDRDNGSIIFSGIVTSAGLPIAGLKLYGDELISIGGSKLVQINAESGTERRTMDMGYAIMCPAARNSSYFYLSGADKRLHTLRAKDNVQIFEVAAENESMITSIYADEDSVIFATDAGNVISIAPNAPKRLWQFNASDAIAGPIVRDGYSLFFASKDTNVYRVDMVGLPERKRLIWKYQAAAVLDKAPRVTQQVVYQYVYGKGVTAIDKENGTLLWTVPGGVDLLAQSKGKAYVITNKSTLVVMDNARAKKLYSVNFAGVSKYAANIADSKIYIADKRGRIACLQPIE